jgi:methylenetetrahydrofolate dehydrogenase (NADP+) / methenyltetrahydrofolate cyclohydrolase
MRIIDGRKIRDEILKEVAEGVKALPFVPVFCDVLVGEDPASAQYVRMKAKTAESVGIKFYTANFPANIETDDLVKEIKKINSIPNMCGIIIQLPLPPEINKRAVLDAIEPRLDVDCLGAVASGGFYNGENKVGYPTALAFT